jgi:hypothetical protein
MAQHDMTVDNGAGLAVRTDINNALKALVSQSSGATAPSPSFPCQLWADTGTGRLKRRDSANTLWLDVGILDALGEVQTVASATLTDIGTATSPVIAISGTTTITGLGSVAAGVTRKVRFLGALTLTHNATSLILPGGFNILTAANDTAEFQSLGSGNWLCLRYNLSSVKPGPVIGTVSQSGGAVTGSIIESGSNANGLYTKYADGTLICRFVSSASVSVSIAYGTGFYGTIGWSFPIASVSAPAVSAIFTGSAGVLLPNLTSVTTSTANFIAFNPNGTSLGTITVFYSLTAIGRWF